MQAKHEQLVRDDNNYEGYLRSIEGDVTYGSPAPTIPRHRSSKYADRKNLSTEWERVVNSHAPLIERIEVR